MSVTAQNPFADAFFSGVSTSSLCRSSMRDPTFRKLFCPISKLEKTASFPMVPSARAEGLGIVSNLDAEVRPFSRIFAVTAVGAQKG